MPILRQFNCGCTFKCTEEKDAINHAKETGHEIHGLIKIRTASQVMRKETHPVHGHFVGGRFIPDGQ